MTQNHPNSSSEFQTNLNTALKAYEKKTGSELVTHPLAERLEPCNSPTDIISVFEDLVQQFDRHRKSDQSLTKWLKPTVEVLYALSKPLGQIAGFVCPPAQMVFSGIGNLLSAAKNVDASQDSLIDIFERIGNFMKRLELYMKVPPTAMTDTIVEILKEVLSIMAIARKEIEQCRPKRIFKKLLGRHDIEDALKNLDKLTTEESRMAIAEIYLVSRQSANTADVERQCELREKLRNWLSPPDPSINHNSARKAHHEGTASWFFQSSNFEEWKSSPSLLWIHGKPGSGKSILCSGIIEDIRAQRGAKLAILAYFYCDFRDKYKQDCRNLILSIIWQLCAQSDLCYDTISHVHSANERSSQKPSDETLTKCLIDMVSLPDQGPIYLIFDALDECPNNSGMLTPREEVLNLVKGLVSLHLPDLHICVTSRPEIDIQAVLEPLTTLRVSLHDESGQKKDISDFVRSFVSSDAKMQRWREEDRALVIKTLSERAGGMFKWVGCQLELLRHCLAPSLRKILEELPETLDGTYEQILRGISKPNREHAHRLLQCLTVALRPLRVDELAEVLAIDFDAPTHMGIPQWNPDWRWADQRGALLSACSSLIEIVGDGYSEMVQFSHSSVKEFLTSDRLAHPSDVSFYRILLEPAHTIFAQACLGVLLHLDSGMDRHNSGDIPLVEYAARHWFDHARFENVASSIWGAMTYFFDADKQHWTAWCQVQTIDEPWEWFESDLDTDYALPLYYASLLGFYDLAEHLIGKNPEHINARGGRMVSPLVAALRGKHFQIAELLHRNGADVDVRDRYKDTPLREACRAGVLDILQWLLDHGADLNAQNYMGWTALHGAINYGQPQAFQMLVARKPDFQIRTNLGKSPLHLAASPQVDRDHADFMRVLLDHGADPNARDSDGSTPLHHSSWWEKEGYCPSKGTAEGTCLLLEHGAIFDAEDNKDRTPMRLAWEHGRLDIMICLFQYGATR